MIQLQLMCCALSNLSSSQFTKGRIKRHGIEGKSEELEGAMSNSIFELKRVMSSYGLYTTGMWWSRESRAPSISKCPGKHKVQIG